MADSKKVKTTVGGYVEPTFSAVEEVKEADTVYLNPIQEKDPAPEEPKRGKVANCIALNLRKMANIKSEILQALPEGTTVLVHIKDSTESFYAVQLHDGKTGFCLKDYIEV